MWRNSARYPQFFFFDARVVFPLLLWAFHWSWWTFYVALGGMFFFWTILRLGYTPQVFFRKCLIWLFRGDRSGRNDLAVMRRRCRW